MSGDAKGIPLKQPPLRRWYRLPSNINIDGNFAWPDKNRRSEQEESLPFAKPVAALQALRMWHTVRVDRGAILLTGIGVSAAGCSREAPVNGLTHPKSYRGKLNPR